MAHYALVKNGLVQVVYGVANDVITDDEGVEQEALGQEFLAGLYGENPADFIQCSYNANFRGVYPGPGFAFDPVADVFAAPVPVVVEVQDEAV